MKSGIHLIKVLTLTIMLLSCPYFIYAGNQEWEKKFEDANIYFEIGDYLSAIKIYKELYFTDSGRSDLSFKMGVCYFSLNKKEESQPYFNDALKGGVNESLFFLGQLYHEQEEFDKAIETFQQYQILEKPEKDRFDLVTRMIETADYASKMINDPVKVEIVNLGAKVNTIFHEYAPLVYGAQNELFFTSRRENTTGSGKDPYGRYFEDVYFSKKDHGEWQSPIQLGPYINTPTNDASVGISPDGQILYIFRTNDDLISGDLLESEIGTSGWGEPVKLGSQINSEYVESSASISNDERTFYFSSNRPGGYGGKDIYRVVKLPTGQWSLPLNLGPVINTAYDEDAPFIHADNKTLYFSSNGHKTIGGYDIFQSELKENGSWSIPVNLGYPVNSVYDDLNFVMSPDKQNGYYSSAQEGGFGGQDLYVINFKLYAEVLSVVKGGVFSESGSTIPLGAKITLINSETRNLQGIYKTNDKTGKFIMVVTPEQNYTMVVEAEGYHTYSKEVSFTAENLFAKSIKEINLVPTEVADFE